jgi:signal transduction histidine kinase
MKLPGWFRLPDRLRGWLTQGPEGFGLAGLLAGINAVLVTLVVFGISLSAIGRLGDLADEQGLARVELAGAAAREELRKRAEGTLESARMLAARPTLERLLRRGQQAALVPFLRRFCDNEGLDTCAVLFPAGEPVMVGREIPLEDALDALQEQGERFLTVPDATEAPFMGAVASVEGYNARVLLIETLDQDLADELAAQVGLPVRLLNYLAFADEPPGPFTALHSRALADGRSAAARLNAADAYVASLPVAGSTGEVVALLEVRQNLEDSALSVRRLAGNLLAFAVFLGGVAVLAGVLLGRWVAAPVRALSSAAERLGQGDFSTHIPATGPAEVGALGRTMEDMRRSLVELTTTLRRREAEAQAVLGGIVEGVFAVDKDRRIRYLNPRAEQLLGVEAAAASGRFCGDVLKPGLVDGRRPCDTAACPILQARREGSARATERLQPADGPPRTTVITSAGLVDNIQVQVIRDETELEGVRRARDSVLANISHEFRTPLAAQLASIELLREGLDTLEPAQQRELVLSLERGTLRLTRLIDNLLESVRIESGQLSLRRQPVSLPDLLDTARGLMGSLLEQRHQSLAVEWPTDLPGLEGDQMRLTQVLVNLLANASKFAPEGSTLYVGAATGDGQVSFWVEDEGPGVPELDTGSIFDRFYRGGPDEPEPSGLGLGLWISKSIVERHQGSITAGRTPEGRTRFTVTLPAGPAA